MSQLQSGKLGVTRGNCERTFVQFDYWKLPFALPRHESAPSMCLRVKFSLGKGICQKVAWALVICKPEDAVERDSSQGRQTGKYA
jgi:hypothetical protein